MKIKLIVLGLFIVLLTISCGVNDSETIIKPIEPGRRDYVWEVDTLNTPGGMMNCIWGSSPTDVWAAGYSIYVPHSEIWHYNGNTWTMFTDIQYTWVPTCMHGFSENNIWIGGTGGRIYHYDGKSWLETYKFNDDSLNNMTIKKIWGKSTDNIYAVGVAFTLNSNVEMRSMILHYNGIAWEAIYKNNSSIQYFTIREYNGSIYMVGQTTQFTGNDYYKIYKYSNNSMKEIFSGKFSQFDGCNLEIIGGELYFMVGKSLMKYNNTTFTEILKVDSDNYTSYACGRNIKDIFFFADNGIIHYNGNDYQYIFEFTRDEIMLFSKPIIFDNDIFITAVELNGNKSRIIHGHLPN